MLSEVRPFRKTGEAMVSALCKLEVRILMLLLGIQTAFAVRSLLHSQPINSCIQVRGSAADKLHDTKTDVANKLIQIHGSLPIQHVRSTPPPGTYPVPTPTPESPLVRSMPPAGSPLYNP
ncbi:hypothetical protein KP509_14G086000 [Ceratopteris richardii]|uniref:Uncharacterized protein n=1 Tax=Ceratopteris richardii TaxID=49495 RepID=A0A8T2TBX1_CERRI|nr:hypothetical protein KP509_14G086000 [Ceratopteris richardii]